MATELFVKEDEQEELLEQDAEQKRGHADWRRVETPRGNFILRRTALLRKKLYPGLVIRIARVGNTFHAEGDILPIDSVPGQSFTDFMEIVSGYIYSELDRD